MLEYLPSSMSLFSYIDTFSILLVCIINTTLEYGSRNLWQFLKIYLWIWACCQKVPVKFTVFLMNQVSVSCTFTLVTAAVYVLVMLKSYPKQWQQIS